MAPRVRAGQHSRPGLYRPPLRVDAWRFSRIADGGQFRNARAQSAYHAPTSGAEVDKCRPARLLQRRAQDCRGSKGWASRVHVHEDCSIQRGRGQAGSAVRPREFDVFDSPSSFLSLRRFERGNPAVPPRRRQSRWGRRIGERRTVVVSHSCPHQRRRPVMPGLSSRRRANLTGLIYGSRGVSSGGACRWLTIFATGRRRRELLLPDSC